MTADRGSLSEPVVYVADRGTPDQFATLLASVAALVQHEPPDTFASAGVRAAAWHLCGLLTERAEQCGGFDTADVWHAKRARSLLECGMVGGTA